MDVEYDPEAVGDVEPGPSYRGDLMERTNPYDVEQAPTMAERVSFDTVGMDTLSTEQPVTLCPHEGLYAVTQSDAGHHMDNVYWNLTHQLYTVADSCLDPRLMRISGEVDVPQVLEQEDISPVPTPHIAVARSDSDMSLLGSDPAFAAIRSMNQLPHVLHVGSLPVNMPARPTNTMLEILDQRSYDPRQPPWEPMGALHANPQDGSTSSTSGFGSDYWPFSTPAVPVTPSTSTHPELMSCQVSASYLSPILVHQNYESEFNTDPRQHLRVGQGRVLHPHLPTRPACDFTTLGGLQDPAAMAESPSVCLSAPGDLMQMRNGPSPTPSEISVTPSNVSDILACDINGCEIRFTGLHRRNNFCRHKRLFHNDAKFPCDVNSCEKIYRRTDALLKHHRKQHTCDLPQLKPPEKRKHRKSF